MSALEAVQAALMPYLAGGLTTVGGRVYDFIPAESQFPYARLSTPSEIPIDETCWDRTALSIQLDFWSNEKESREVKEISGQAKALLHEREQDLIVPGYVVDSMMVEGIFYSREQETALQRARLMLAIDVQPT
ncbi:DUF3168 domain-containing protein [Pelagibacterium lentulum]|uniref:DUF3168 domain-containing protein n=1 Tax=Pelagibacterium lentulum TaxID=2029865 RepID=A0A916W3Y4_9HYPH|nr:DUF3168 domain-containing protein [Pelagibacterium lentulum]GGA63869.1 hypothetical protein GCM10011499_37830 [Pelagibacterium lentulum]